MCQPFQLIHVEDNYNIVISTEITLKFDESPKLVWIYKTFYQFDVTMRDKIMGLLSIMSVLKDPTKSLTEKARVNLKIVPHLDQL